MIVTLTSDYWESVINDERVDYVPSWTSLDQALSRLDGLSCTLVTMEDDKGSTLFVGGSSTGVVVCWSEGDRHLIARKGIFGKRISVNVGGQVADYSMRNVLSIEDAKNIAKRYFNGADMNSLAEWEHS